MSYKDTAGSLVSVPLKARTRGIWRLRMCDFPPLRLNFSSDSVKGTIFRHLDKPKLVSYCQDRDGYERYVLQEYQLYRIYQVLTPVSHRARLLTRELARSADLVLAMSGQQRDRAAALGAGDRAHTLGEFAGASGAGAILRLGRRWGSWLIRRGPTQRSRHAKGNPGPA